MQNKSQFTSDHLTLKKNGYLIAASLSIDDVLLDSCWNADLLGLDQIHEIKSSPTVRNEKVRFVEEILKNKDCDLKIFCRCIRGINSELADFLTSEYDGMSNPVIHDRVMHKEATSMVFKVFGFSRRMSEQDKKQIACLVCLIATRAVQKQMKEVIILKEKLKRSKSELIYREKQLKEIFDRLDRLMEKNSFLKKGDNLIDTRTTSDALSEMRKLFPQEKQEISKSLFIRVDSLIESFDHAFYEIKRNTNSETTNETTKEAKKRTNDEQFVVSSTLASPDNIDRHRDLKSIKTSIIRDKRLDGFTEDVELTSAGPSSC